MHFIQYNPNSQNFGKKTEEKYAKIKIMFLPVWWDVVEFMYVSFSSLLGFYSFPQIFYSKHMQFL